MGYVMSTITLLVGTALSYAGGNGAGPSITVDSAFLYGSIDGYLQTPAGGNPGTTTSKRPTLDELGLDRVSLYDGSARMQWSRHVLYGGAQIIRLSGAETLTRPLISQNVIFNVGDLVEADVQLDWYRFGYLYQLDWWADHRNDLSLSIGADVALFDFHYKLDGTAGKVDRAYAKPAVRLGSELAWTLTRKLSMRARVFESLPFANTPSVLTLELRGAYRLFELRQVKGEVYAGIAYNRIDYEDNQEVPNHIRAEMGPLLAVGATLEF